MHEIHVYDNQTVKTCTPKQIDLTSHFVTTSM